MKPIPQMVTEYEANLAALQMRKSDLIAQRHNEPSFEKRHKLTMRIIALEQCIGSSTAALHAMREYLAR